MPNVLPNIPQEPAQGIQALLDTVYLWNPDVANELIDKVNELLEELGDLTNLGAIKPYAELVAPIPQYLPMSYNNAIYVANEELEDLPATPDLTKWTQIATKVDQGAIETQIRAEENARIAEDAILQGNIDSEASARAQADTALGNRITAEETARSGADSNLQTQIDAISASSDVKDIVGTHAELEQYDTSTLGDNDIIKVLQDETEEGATTYYRWVEADQEFSLIGEEGPYYTKEQTNTLLGQKQNTLTAGEGITIENDVISATASGDFVPQLDVLPTADASNVGEIAQYSGETTPDVPASAVATQTVGSGLSDLAVNVDKFVEAEQPSGSETVSFVADVVPDTSVVVEATMSSEDYTFDGDTFIAKVKETWADPQYQDQYGFGTKYLVFEGAEQGGQSWGLCLNADGSAQVAFIGDNPQSWGLTVTNQPSSHQYIMLNTTRGSTTWSKNGTTVNLTNYGITYSGTPANGDTISVAYTPLIAGITNGYFYTNQPTYTDPSAAISHTAGQTDSISFETTVGNTEISGTTEAVRAWFSANGWTPTTSDTLTFECMDASIQSWRCQCGSTPGYNSVSLQDWYERFGFVFTGEPRENDTVICTYTLGNLSNLSVDVDIFIEAEQPIQSGNTSFVADVIQSYISYDPDVVQDPNNYIFTMAEQAFGTASIVSYIEIISVDEDGTATGAILHNRDGGYVNLGNLAENNVIISVVAVGQEVPATYHEGTTTWSKNGTTVDLADYGISYSGSPVDGDTLTVAYTAPVVTGYAWNQINVQPSSGGGKSAGIEWKTKVDLPAEYTGDGTHIRPYYTITGGLPDGTYEFYFSTKVTSDSNTFPLGEVIFKVIMSIDNTNATFYGKMGYVFDGNYMNDGNYVFGDNEKQLYTLVFKNGSDTILYGPDYPWASDVFGYITPRLVPECFKLSAIKNVDTGDEYIATGAINLDGSGPTYTTQYGGFVKLVQLVNAPSIPSNVGSFVVTAADFATKTVLLRKNVVEGSVHLNTYGSELIINFTGVGGNRIVPYSQEIIRATGIFSGCYLAYGANYIYVMGVDTTTAATLSGDVNCACSGLSSDGMAIWFDTIPTQSLTQLAQFGPQAYRLGTITSDGIGNIVQYTGATDANYTNGHFYKANGTIVPVPASITFTNFNPSDITVTVANPDALITALNNVGGWGEQWVRDNLALYPSNFNLDYDFDTGTVTKVWWANYGDMHQQDVLDCFAVSTTGSYSGLLNISFVCDMGYAPAHSDVTNPSWDRIDVQPGGGTTVTIITED